MKSMMFKYISIFVCILFIIISCKKNTPSSNWIYPLITPSPTRVVAKFWEQSTSNSGFEGRSRSVSLIYKDKIWILGGHEFSGGCEYNKNDVWSSSNGIDWQMATRNALFHKRYYHTGVAFNNYMWIIGGFYDQPCSTNPQMEFKDVWRSNNGVDWTLVTGNAAFGTRNQHDSVVFNDRIWVIGGSGGSNFLNDVWYSLNGYDWVLATGNAGFTPRADFSSVVFNNKIWVIGGFATDGMKNDIWCSADGINWIVVSTGAGFSERANHASVIYDNKMWVIAGYTLSSDYNNDVWQSSNGIDWYASTRNAEFSPRTEQSSVTFNNKIYIIGGYCGFNPELMIEDYKNDVWYSQ